MIKRLHQAEDLLLALLAIALVLLAGFQLAARWPMISQFLPTMTWADSVLKALVLWLAMLGALAAARDDKHLGMDALLHVLKPTAKRIAKSLACLFACAVAGYVAWWSYQYVLLERESPSDVHSLIPSWLVIGIFPISFAGMSVRFLLHAIHVWRVSDLNSSLQVQS
jgi:TRAP-type C4-dicarboxylate transport system permease small subunit